MCCSMRIATNNSHSWQSQTLFWANNMDNTLTLIKNTKQDVKLKTGLERLRDLTDYFQDSVWLNPDDRRYWHHETIEAIWDLVPMYFLSIDGLQRAVKKLLGK